MSQTVLCFVGYVVSFIMVVLAGALYRNFYPLMVFIPMVMTVILAAQVIMSRSQIRGTWNGAWADFFEMFFWTSMFGLLAVMLHVEVIESSQFGIAVAGCAVLFISRVRHEYIVAEGY